ncbi:DUF1700 domain-containing protein [Adlercreutzia sp. R21]|uniref:DUF1700 domain-containing protein n=1 Tax=Adlercreutzia wanghongyangiae TaxID=3111451 RepID=UPI002DB7AF8D|nr:DUF1700 domain-containing protein [Adlercreutzia sp. R21]MEC4184429.1 DUF1700 domain-containing protein [Adlercreutzia sp. R21]
MNKQEYLGKLREALACLSDDEIDESVAFYAEMIDDRMADGMAEEEAVAQLDDPKTAARAIIGDLPVEVGGVAPAQACGARPKSKPMNRVLYWTLVILGSPLWLTLLLAAAAVAIAVVAVAAALILSAAAVVASLLLTLWALAVGLMAGGPLGIAVCLYGLAMGQPAYAAAELGGGLVCFGVGLFCLHGAVAATKAASRLWRASIAKAKGWLARGKSKIRARRDAEAQGPAVLASLRAAASAKEAAHEA